MPRRTNSWLAILFTATGIGCGSDRKDSFLKGLDDTLTIAGILLAFFFGILYLVRKFWRYHRRRSGKK